MSFLRFVDTEVEACFQTIISILFTLRSGVDSVAVVAKIVDAVSGKTDSKPRLRLKVLISVFNLISAPVSRFQTICSECILSCWLQLKLKALVLCFCKNRNI